MITVENDKRTNSGAFPDSPVPAGKEWVIKLWTGFSTAFTSSAQYEILVDGVVVSEISFSGIDQLDVGVGADGGATPLVVLVKAGQTVAIATQGGVATIDHHISYLERDLPTP